MDSFSGRAPCPCATLEPAPPTPAASGQHFPASTFPHGWRGGPELWRFFSLNEKNAYFLIKFININGFWIIDGHQPGWGLIRHPMVGNDLINIVLLYK
jgi:hypothetical protein